MQKQWKSFSGIFPHLAVTHDGAINGQGECGIGAVVAHAGRLYFITYPANCAHGGSGRIYSVDADGALTLHPESAGGTHANRMLHRATGKLALGNSIIDPDGSIRSFDVGALVGRLTAAGVHLHDPDAWLYINTMEDGLYEVNVETMAVRCLRRDILDRMLNADLLRAGAYAREKLPGDHGKAGYTGQGVFVFANNGHGGVLAEWDGQGDAQSRDRWKVIDRNKYAEVTGPGGIEGPRSEGDPLWALGWDARSVLLGVRHAGRWTRYRLPKASYTQDADHGWFTEWPRIRCVDGAYLMCVHGMLYQFPGQFEPRQANGIRPLARHLKMIADYEAWQGGIACACDDASLFDNPLLGRFQSNLWFTTLADIGRMSMPYGFGGPYLRDPVVEHVPSEPFFIGGFTQRTLGISVQNVWGARFTLETDAFGNGAWTPAMAFTLPGDGHAQFVLPDTLPGDWVRIVSDRDISDCTVYFHLRMREDVPRDPALTQGLHAVDSDAPYAKGRLVPLAGEDMRLGFFGDDGFYALDGALSLTREAPPEPAIDLEAKPAIDPACRVTAHSVQVIDGLGQRYHLPRLHPAYDGLEDRVIREVVTERSLLNAHGTLYELPRPESGGVRRMKPVTTHGLRIHDFCSWRGMLVLSGVDEGAKGEHIVSAAAGGPALWLGNVDDLWRFGPPRGEGGPLFDTPVLAGAGSDPFLMAGYDQKRATLRHDAPTTVRFTLDIDFAADGLFLPFTTLDVPAGEALDYTFPEGFAAHWIRVRVDQDCRATAYFQYT